MVINKYPCLLPIEMLAFAEDLAKIVSSKDKKKVRKHLSGLELVLSQEIADLPKPTPIIRVFALYHSGEIIDTPQEITGPKATDSIIDVGPFSKENLAGFYLDHKGGHNRHAHYTNDYQMKNTQVPSASIIKYALAQGAQVIFLGTEDKNLKAYVPLFGHITGFFFPPKQYAIGKKYARRELTEAIERNSDPVIVIRPPEFGPTAGFVEVKYRIDKSKNG